jgi:hypothetical protein
MFFLLVAALSHLVLNACLCPFKSGGDDMPNALEERATKMSDKLESERKSYLSSARLNYVAVQVMSFASSAAGIAAALLGLIPSETIQKWEVGIVAAISPTLIAASRQLGFQLKANWHYRKVDSIKTLQRRLAYELPAQPNADNLAAISRAWSALDTDMSKEWEDIQHEPTPRRGKGAKTDTHDPAQMRQ